MRNLIFRINPQQLQHPYVMPTAGFKMDGDGRLDFDPHPDSYADNLATPASRTKPPRSGRGADSVRRVERRV